MNDLYQGDSGCSCRTALLGRPDGPEGPSYKNNPRSGCIPRQSAPSPSRRDFLWHSGGGLGGIALAWLLGREGALAGTPTPRAGLNGGLHHKARVRRIIQLFMNGGVSQMDTFDYKPELIKKHGEKVDFGLKAAATSVPGNVMKCPFEWKHYGQTGPWITPVFHPPPNSAHELPFLISIQPK